MKVIEIMAQSAMLLGLGDEFLLLEDAKAEQENVLLENKNIIKSAGFFSAFNSVVVVFNFI